MTLRQRQFNKEMPHISKEVMLMVQIKTNDVKVIASTNTFVLQANPKRKAFNVTNLDTAGGQQISLGFGTAAIAGSGEVLLVGQFYGESDDPAFSCWKGEISAIASGAGNANLAVSERSDV